MNREKQYLDMMNQWLILKHEGKGIEGYLQHKGYRSIAIYGMAVYGRHVVRELQGTGVAIAYGIDQKKMKPYKGVKVLQPTGELPYADVIINTVIHDHMGVKTILSGITDIPVIGLEDVVFDSYDWGNQNG